MKNGMKPGRKERQDIQLLMQACVSSKKKDRFIIG